jgi:hypothetical protein
MLLNEMQKEHCTVASLVTQHEADAAKIASLEQRVADFDDLRQQLSAVIQELNARDKLVAQRQGHRPTDWMRCPATRAGHLICALALERFHCPIRDPRERQLRVNRAA